MILGIGTDIVLTERFNNWVTYAPQRLAKIFTPQELRDCSSDGVLIPEKLAARFAAKEAFYKAFSVALVQLGLTGKTFSLLFACPHVTITAGTWQVPVLKIDWAVFEKKIGANLPALSVHVSISHEKTAAIAFVVISHQETN